MIILGGSADTDAACVRVNEGAVVNKLHGLDRPSIKLHPLLAQQPPIPTDGVTGLLAQHPHVVFLQKRLLFTEAITPLSRPVAIHQAGVVYE